MICSVDREVKVSNFSVSFGLVVDTGGSRTILVHTCGNVECAVEDFVVRPWCLLSKKNKFGNLFRLHVFESKSDTLLNIYDSLFYMPHESFYGTSSNGQAASEPPQLLERIIVALSSGLGHQGSVDKLIFSCKE